MLLLQEQQHSIHSCFVAILIDLNSIKFQRFTTCPESDYLSLLHAHLTVFLGSRYNSPGCGALRRRISPPGINNTVCNSLHPDTNQEPRANIQQTDFDSYPEFEQAIPLPSGSTYFTGYSPRSDTNGSSPGCKCHPYPEVLFRLRASSPPERSMYSPTAGFVKATDSPSVKRLAP